MFAGESVRTWAALFASADGSDCALAEIRDILSRRRADGEGASTESAVDTGGETGDARSGEGENGTMGIGPDPGASDEEGVSPTRIVADADVLAADVLVGGNSRAALDSIRQHSWLTLVASDPLLADARAVIESLGSEGLAVDWQERIGGLRTGVKHPAGDHPGLASAYYGGAAHLLSTDENFTGAQANLSLQAHVTVSVRTPDAFAAVFDAGNLYEATFAGTYPGPDRDQRE